MEPPLPPLTGRCPRCGAPHDPYQEYCLECGERLPSRYHAVTRESSWSRESPLWLAATLIGLLLFAAGAAAAVLVGREDDPPPAAATPQEETEPPLITEPDTVTLPETETILPPGENDVTIPRPTPPAPPPGPPPPPAAGAGLVQWPTGQAGYTVVLMSVPVAQDRARAEEAANRALDGGLSEVGVLESGDFTSLRPGFYVVFAGIHETLAEAERALPNVRNAGFPLAYVREIRP